MSDTNQKLDKLDQRLDDITVTLTRNTASLEEHVRRTNILEEEMRPVKAHVAFMNALAKIAVVAWALLTGLKNLPLF